MVNQEQITKTIDDILTRGVGEFIDPDGKFRAKLVAKMEGKYPKDIVIKFGVDPTRPDIHLGHAVILHKLRQFQDIGCKVIFLIGDYTAQIGDPTGKSKVRPELEQAAVETNMNTYLAQVGKILSTDPLVFAWIRNSDWFTAPTDLSLPDDYKVSINGAPVDPNSFVGKAAVFEETRMQKKLGLKQSAVVTMRSLIWALRHITHAQLIERDMFKDRIEKGESLFMHEMLYPIFQGIDSHVLASVFGSCDLEIGGTDQTFNMLVGRKIMEANKQEPQAVISCALLVGLDGVEKMSKSLDNYITITDAPNDMYGKVMSIPDSALLSYAELCTFTPMEHARHIGEELKKGKINPRDVKMRLARQIVAIYHGEEAAEGAEKAFVETFQKGKLPDDVSVYKVASKTPMADALLATGVVASKNEFRRLVEEGAVTEWEGKKISDPFMAVDRTMTLKVGKRRFVTLEVS